MNSALLLSNAIAIAVLVIFHFQPDGSADQSTQYRAHSVQHQAPQWAVMSSTSENPGMTQVSDTPEAIVLPANPRPESWVF
ncbi:MULTISPECIES: hypothetical protein [Pseudomonas]|uniref:Uncharacterized protein n=1 Tax=Pseudomonas chlororaphis subsp. aureofaciens TaxID=587851 RepID=A0AAD0ZL72_9PSED|nr:MULTISPECIES: hypothetical protein [Pseudomonas]AIC21639.1 hypothetical protein EY04_22805 [Pseudomonas chlororaphis]AZE25178.1 hypothetical protein C4K08_4770 [Pseudomonas chlororaphis subsp. aureofaciens]AZE31378.1 hypothetical protein C4K07_4612 [Pseudomonas chlororaphis subsp. aureofaciens]AZE44090.1 hypothetical protein C4K05_4769 [Pseudomonas chlororaphis subsp. aureofaciens]POA73008.1 hypothetical protein C1888_09585 [Pseudomonas sp. GW531-T4]